MPLRPPPDRLRLGLLLIRTHIRGLLLVDLIRRLVTLRKFGCESLNFYFEFLNAFDQESMFALELFHVASEESDIKAAQEMLGGVEQSLLNRGFTESDLKITVEIATDPETAIVEQATSHNVVVIGETEEQPESDRFFGLTYERIAERTDVPVAVVRRRC